MQYPASPDLFRGLTSAEAAVADARHKLDLADASIVRAQRNYELRKQQRSALFAGNPTPEERFEAGQLVMRAEERLARTKKARALAKRMLTLAQGRLDTCRLHAEVASRYIIA